MIDVTRLVATHEPPIKGLQDSAAYQVSQCKAALAEALPKDAPDPLKA